MPFNVGAFQAIVGGMKSYDDAMAQGDEGMAAQYYQEVMGGINALKGITGIRGARQRMRIEGAEERRRAALHPGILETQRAEEAERVAMRPVELRTAEAGAERAEITSEQMQMQLDEARTTIEALRARLEEVGAPPTMEAMEKWEGIDEWVAAQKGKRAEAKVEAEIKGYTVETLAREIERRELEAVKKERLPERKAEVAEVELGLREKKVDYETMVIDAKIAEGVPETEARQIGLMASRELDQADAAIKLARRNARLAATRADALEEQMEADRLQREAMEAAGLDLGDMMITKSRIEAGLIPKANELQQNIKDAMRIWTALKTQPAGEIDPMKLWTAGRLTGPQKELYQQMLPSPKEREEAMRVVEDYSGVQKAILKREFDMDYEALAESALMYDKSDLETARSDEKIKYEAAYDRSVEGVETYRSAPDITGQLDDFALWLLNNADLLREDVLEAISGNMAEGQNLYQMYGQANIDKLYQLLDALQKDRVTTPSPVEKEE